MKPCLIIMDPTAYMRWHWHMCVCVCLFTSERIYSFLQWSFQKGHSLLQSSLQREHTHSCCGQGGPGGREAARVCHGCPGRTREMLWLCHVPSGGLAADSSHWAPTGAGYSSAHALRQAEGKHTNMNTREHTPTHTLNVVSCNGSYWSTDVWGYNMFHVCLMSISFSQVSCGGHIVVLNQPG